MTESQEQALLRESDDDVGDNNTSVLSNGDEPAPLASEQQFDDESIGLLYEAMRGYLSSPICRQPFYRTAMLLSLPSLTRLDSLVIEQRERDAVLNHRPGMRRMLPFLNFPSTSTTTTTTTTSSSSSSSSLVDILPLQQLGLKWNNNHNDAVLCHAGVADLNTSHRLAEAINAEKLMRRGIPSSRVLRVYIPSQWHQRANQQCVTGGSLDHTFGVDEESLSNSPQRRCDQCGAVARKRLVPNEIEFHPRQFEVFEI